MIASFAETEARLSALRGRQARLQQDEDTLAGVKAELARKEDPDGAKRDEEELADARRRREAALLHKERITSAERAAAIAGRALDNTRAGAADARQALAGCAAALAAAQGRADHAAARLRRARHVMLLSGLAVARDAHVAALYGAEAAEERVHGLAARLEAAALMPARIDALRAAGRVP